jgi:hypothetical protein
MRDADRQSLFDRCRGHAMNRREALLSAALVFAVALAVRAWAASLIVFPQPEDTAYYVAVARNLLEGRGLVTDALWSYQTPPLEVPRAAFEVWLPLPTFLAAIPMAILGKTFGAAQISSIVVGAAVPVLAWRLAADVAGERDLPRGRVRTLALGTGLTAAVYLPLVLHGALPDSTMPFAALALGACLLMTRIIREPRDAQGRDPRLLTLGLVIGLAAWTRNEAIWLLLTWAIVAWLPAGHVSYSRQSRLRMIAVVGAVAIIVFMPWAIRDTIEFGTPFPGQALANALSVNGTDIFAWKDPPTLARYFAAGPAVLAEMRVEGTLHNLLNVLLLLGIPVAAIGLVGLPWTGRARALRPLVLFSVVTFAVDSLVFPVSTTWGTFLHAAGAVHVLLIVSCLLALDAVIARVGQIRGWSRPVAWLGATLAIAGSLLFSAAVLPSFGEGSRATGAQYEALVGELQATGHELRDLGPVISDHPIWLADLGARALGLPAEPAASVIDLATHFGARFVVVTPEQNDPTSFPSVIAQDVAMRGCFQEVVLGKDQDPAAAQESASLRMFQISDGCR